jgi:N-formylmethionyl-tRNA deformylase
MSGRRTKRLMLVRLGDPILRTVARRLDIGEIRSAAIKNLITDMRLTSESGEYGVGLSAPQVGESVAISLIAIKPTPNRPELERSERVMINPKIVETFGRRTGMWEGCASIGSGDDILYAKVPRWKRVRVEYFDEAGKVHDEALDGFVAHVAQHEIDHLNGIVFTDLVKDKTSFMMADEYKKRVINN